jgi:YYY domain-containing protein
LILALVLASNGYAVALVAVPLALVALLASILPYQRRTRRFLWLMVALAMVLCLAVEIVVLKGDIGRMNTVFKFYLQVWVMLAIVAGVSLAWVSAYVRRWRRQWRRLWWFGMGLLLAGGALFLPLGIRARAVDRISSQTGATLDGMAFMQYATVREDRGQTVEFPLSGDYYAIRWMQENIPGSPVIIEGLGRHEYLWGNRVSIYTGLPAVVGWRWHQVQQYTVLPEDVVERRRSDVNEFYSTDDIQRALELIARYDVQYIYVGDYERAYYSPMGLAKFDAMVAQGELEVAYDAHGVKIYRVTDQ